MALQLTVCPGQGSSALALGPKDPDTNLAEQWDIHLESFLPPILLGTGYLC